MDELTIVIPVLSAFKKMPALLDDLAGYLKANPGDINLIIVVDETVAQPESIIAYVKEKYPWFKMRVLQKFGAGSIANYGALVRFGMAYASSKYIVLVSSRGEDDLSRITVMLTRIRQGYQVVQGTRYANPADAKHVTWLFRLYQSLYRRLVWIFTGLKISDSTYAFKMFDRVFVQALGVSRNRMSLCPEITIKSLLAGGKVDYVSSTVRTVKGVSDFRLLREGPGYFLVILRALLHRLGIRWF